MVATLAIDCFLALTVSLKQSPGGEPLCCKINAVVLFQPEFRHTSVPWTFPRTVGPITARPFGVYPVMYGTKAKVGSAVPHSAGTAGAPVAGRRDNDTTR